jgi:hypothetical protein
MGKSTRDHVTKSAWVVRVCAIGIFKATLFTPPGLVKVARLECLVPWCTFKFWPRLSGTNKHMLCPIFGTWVWIISAMGRLVWYNTCVYECNSPTPSAKYGEFWGPSWPHNRTLTGNCPLARSILHLGATKKCLRRTRFSDTSPECRSINRPAEKNGTSVIY